MFVPDSSSAENLWLCCLDSCPHLADPQSRAAPEGRRPEAPVETWLRAQAGSSRRGPQRGLQPAAFAVPSSLCLLSLGLGTLALTPFCLLGSITPKIAPGLLTSGPRGEERHTASWPAVPAAPRAPSGAGPCGSHSHPVPHQAHSCMPPLSEAPTGPLSPQLPPARGRVARTVRCDWGARCSPLLVARPRCEDRVPRGPQDPFLRARGSLLLLLHPPTRRTHWTCWPHPVPAFYLPHFPLVCGHGCCGHGCYGHGC